MLTFAIAVSDDARTVLAMDPSLKLYLISGFPSVVPPLTDLNWDGSTDGIDLGLLLAEWGPVDTDALADVTGDGFVDGLDLAQLLANWGGCSY